MNYRYYLLLIIICFPMLLCAQRESSKIRKGNRQYEKEQYTDAEVEYRRGLQVNSESFEAHYNLGNALFRQNKYDEAAREFSKSSQLLTSDKDKDRLAQTYHNLGNSFYGQQQFDRAIEAYKQSLRLNPKDNDTRYNLVKAMQMLEQQQSQQQEQQQNQSQQQQQQQEQQEQQQQEQQEQQEQEAQAQEAQETDEQMDKETAEQILQALEQDEQATQEKVQKQKGGKKKRVENDW